MQIEFELHVNAALAEIKNRKGTLHNINVKENNFKSRFINN
jgi:hypothetical protein